MKDRRVIKSRRVGDALVISFRVDRINEFEMAAWLGRELKQTLGKRKIKRVVFDFEHMEYVISEAFSVLMQVANQVKKEGMPVVACNLTPFLRDVYATMKLDSVIPVCKSLEEALQT